MLQIKDILATSLWLHTILNKRRFFFLLFTFSYWLLTKFIRTYSDHVLAWKSDMPRYVQVFLNELKFS